MVVRFDPLSDQNLAAILQIEKLSNLSPWSEQSFRNEFDHTHGIARAVLLDGEVVGFGVAWLLVDESHVTNIAIHPDHRRKGLGEKLMRELLVLSREAGMTCATLEVRASNEAAQLLYQKLGFKKTALRKRYYPDNQEDAVVMWLYDLRGWDS